MPGFCGTLNAADFFVVCMMRASFADNVTVTSHLHLSLLISHGFSSRHSVADKDSDASP